MFNFFKKKEIKNEYNIDNNELYLCNEYHKKYNEIEKFIKNEYKNNKEDNIKINFLFDEFINLSIEKDKEDYKEYVRNNKICGYQGDNEYLRKIKNENENEAKKYIKKFKEDIEYIKRKIILNKKQIKKLFDVIDIIKKEHEERFDYHFEEYERVFNKKLEISNCQWSYYSPEFEKEITSDDYQEFLKIKKYKSAEKIPTILKEKIKILEL